ncbi:hypothetical protein [Geoalkalibacter subterraneus]|uniref:hypothetical protein n=1 Tax=Geoalkalibacter subterraneus TaxID=483547 RepID=UPI00130EFB43|nr:hypothetical protein [Geoalkalibacter subterraneus]
MMFKALIGIFAGGFLAVNMERAFVFFEKAWGVTCSFWSLASPVLAEKFLSLAGG